jgi:2-oxoglutarate ferredoxin oxidoreductase subunit beta
MNCDGIQAAHGRAPAVATGVKRTNPDKIVFTYQGDGDLASIGTAEIIHAAHRNENITVVFVNNAIYGMTGGQMAPTSMINQKTSTTPTGRQQDKQGLPFKVCEVLAQVNPSAYIERVSTHDMKHVLAAKQAIKRAFKHQIEGKGFALVELLSTCSIGWGLDPIESLDYVKDTMMPYYPLGAFKQQGESNG